MGQRQGDDDFSGGFDMRLIGNFLSFASRGDRVGLNQMLRSGISPDVQDYDRRTALHLAASEGHAPIVELLLHYKANVNLIDRWKRTVSELLAWLIRLSFIVFKKVVFFFSFNFCFFFEAFDRCKTSRTSRYLQNPRSKWRQGYG